MDGDMCIPCIRNVRKDDAERLLEIYSYYVLNTAVTFDLSVPGIEEFENKIKNITQKYPYLVIEDEGAVKGYAYASYIKEREAYNHSCEVSIYVDSSSKKKGYGRALYEALEEELRKRGIYNLYACISDPIVEDEYLTRDSERFHTRMGYKLAGIFHKCGIKFNRYFNVIWMEKILNEPPDD